MVQKNQRDIAIEVNKSNDIEWRLFWAEIFKFIGQV